tara:strand:- start:2561 stop:3037 length:477 start_codon:yes stop_codon:yes gene_type:complete
MLEYIALGILVFVAITLFYGVIVIHDIPYEIAKKRNHPQQDALHVAGWISLFTLHVLWPFLWIWATLYREDRGWGFSAPEKKENNHVKRDDTVLKLIKLQQRVETLEAALLERTDKEHIQETDVEFKTDNKEEDFDHKTSKLFESIDKLNKAEQQGEK